MSINSLGQAIYENAVRHGFYKDRMNITSRKDPIWLSNRLMLIVSELSEGLEGVRDGNFSSEPASKGLGEELADACIRIFDLAYSINIDLDKAIADKHNFNLMRPYKHNRQF
jgi:NTP pyrophosphatase (non-canonical NTP hydrolase)